MIIEEIQNRAYKTSGRMKAAQKRAEAEAKRQQSSNDLNKISSLFSGGGSKHKHSRSAVDMRIPLKKLPAVDRKVGLRSFGATIGYAAQNQKKVDEDKRAECIYNQNLFLPIDLAADEMKATADQCKTGIRDACRHIVVSWNENEVPDKNEMKDVVATYLKEAGYKDHQAVAYVHKNTKNIHVHIVVNAVNPNTYKGVDRKLLRSKANYRIHEKVAREMEIKYNRIRVHGKLYGIKDNMPTIVKTKSSENNNKNRGKKAFDRNSGLSSFHDYMIDSDDSNKLRNKLLDLMKKPNPDWYQVHELFDRYNLVLKEVIKNGQKFGYIIQDKNNESHVIKASQFDKYGKIFKSKKIDIVIGKEFISSAHSLVGNATSGYGKYIIADTKKHGFFQKYSLGKEAYRHGKASLLKSYVEKRKQINKSRSLINVEYWIKRKKLQPPVELIQRKKWNVIKINRVPEKSLKLKNNLSSEMKSKRKVLSLLRAEYEALKDTFDRENYLYAGSYLSYLQKTFDVTKSQSVQAEIERISKTVAVKDDKKVDKNNKNERNI